MINNRMQDVQNKPDGLNNLEQCVNGIKHEPHGTNSIQGVICQTSNMDKRLHTVETKQAKTNEDIIIIQPCPMLDNLIFENIEENGTVTSRTKKEG